MIAVALIHVLLIPAFGEQWQSEVTYAYRGVQYPSETQVWKWRETYSLTQAGDLSVSRVLLENSIDGQAIPPLDASVPESWVVRNPFKAPVRDPLIEDPSTFRLWRLMQIPRAGEILTWDAGAKWPAATATCKPIGSSGSTQEIPVALTFTEVDGMQGKGTGFCSSDGTFRSGRLLVPNAFLPGGDSSAQRLEITWKALAK